MWVPSYLGWTLPSCIATPALDGESLFGRMTRTMFEELGHYPVGPTLQVHSKRRFDAAVVDRGTSTARGTAILPN